MFYRYNQDTLENTFQDGIDMENRDNRDRDDREKSTAKRPEQSIENRRAEARLQRRKRVQRQRRILGIILLFVLVGIVFAAVIRFRGREDAAKNGKVSNESGNLQDTEANAADSGKLRLELSEADKYTGDLILVNSEYRYHVEENQELVQLVRVAEAKKGNYTVSGPEVQLAGRVMEPLERMIAACEAETGSYLSGISSAYRSVEDQQALYEEYADLYDLEYAKAYVANPGYSEHHTGLAMDLSIFYEDGSEGTFSSSAEAEWYAEYSYRFGFVLRYQASKTEITGISNEEWHFRYVGIPHAYYMYEHDLCLEEYVDWLRSNTSELAPITQACGDETYEIFFTANTSVPLPAESEYLVSGNNVDGYVIAYKRK